MTDITVIILQKNEALHIKRCLEMLKPLDPRQIFVVDCFSTDGSDKLAKEAYYKMPRYLRAFIYFAIRYFLKGGILDGYGGWMWNFSARPLVPLPG